ncbi:hypothetical protein K461DRAFT_52150 [Myriangium duriaei CBS 260.36]|uniref:Uncharacterized protein n=1 Tax=Myriangium duriaei CBS 260.36 TaxID=1168546 RepID=A0A9P4MD15_9PEZI|nr:hypothetical protein K461DRAFT_52150 [Myriangium duriaei CBS 260.36]
MTGVGAIVQRPRYSSKRIEPLPSRTGTSKLCSEAGYHVSRNPCGDDRCSTSFPIAARTAKTTHVLSTLQAPLVLQKFRGAGGLPMKDEMLMMMMMLVTTLESQWPTRNSYAAPLRMAHFGHAIKIMDERSTRTCTSSTTSPPSRSRLHAPNPLVSLRNPRVTRAPFIRLECIAYASNLPVYSTVQCTAAARCRADSLAAA